MTARDRLLVGIVGSVIAILAAWFLLVSPKQDEASKLGGQVAAAQSQLSSAQAQVASARAAQTEYAANYTAVAKLGEAVPADDDVASLIYQLQSAASGSRVDFRSLQISGSSSPAATPASTGPAGTSQAVTASLPPGATVGAAGLPTMPFTFIFRGSFFHLSDFFGHLQRFVTATDHSVSVRGRLMTINSIALAPAQQGFPQIVATISATGYLVPASQGATAGATPSGPAAQPVSSTSTPSPSTSTPSGTAAPATVSTPVK